MKIKKATDKVRASRDGHEFHEAWTARKALQLLLPTDNLIGIAVEGLSPVDHSTAASATVEIADIVLYYGKRPTFKGAEAINVVQFKYSVSGRDVGFRASHAKKTIEKFAAAYLDFRITYGEEDVRSKLRFELITNRPIFPFFEQAIEAIAAQTQITGEVKKQADQFKAACGLDGAELVEFVSKCQFTGLAGNLSENKRILSRTLVDWSAATDPMARARLGGIKQLLRDKAGSAGENRNVIKLTDVLDALEIQDEKDLFPCPDCFPVVGKVVEHNQLSDAVTLIPKLDKPLLIHAAGGVGKTVFLQSLAKALSVNHEVILFDCFGGGAYRAPEDARHLPKHGLVHIVNTLACRGLCDPLLPGNENLDDLVKAFRRRLTQAVTTLRCASSDKEIVLLLDAIDNAAEHAKDRNEVSFPKALLESLQYNGEISGAKLVVSCRTERIALSKGEVDCDELPLRPFSIVETEIYLRGHLKKVSQTEVQVAQARSGGNARILEHLVTSDRGLLDTTEIDNPITLDNLLRNRIENALSVAIARGYKKKQIDAFLAGLAVLPPPVPLEEYAGAHDMDVSAIESFAADLAPLLERTKYGLMFRDEPTETLIRQDYASDLSAVHLVAKNLLARQNSSVYAARALPGLLQQLDDGENLFKLAFDERFPHAITSTVGKRNIRYARLRAAVLHAAHKKNSNQLVHLLVEQSMIAASDHRGVDYILEYPDLVITAQDVDSTRRLFEMRTDWPGTRHARLAIANTLSGDLDEAYRHAVRADEWIDHYRQRDQEHNMSRSGPERLDIAAIPFCLITQNRAKEAVLYIRRWKDWYGYETSEHIFSLVAQAMPVMPKSGGSLNALLDSLTAEIGVISAALSFVELDRFTCKVLITKLTKACAKSKPIESDTGHQQEGHYALRDGLLKAAAIAVSMGLRAEARKILSNTPHERPGMWSFRDYFADQHVFPFLADTALISVVNRKDIHERDILPKELANICLGLRNAGSGSEFRKNLVKRLEHKASLKQLKEDVKVISYEEKRDAERFINEKLEPLFELTKAFANVLGTEVNKADKAFIALLDVWAETRKKRYHYSSSDEHLRFFQMLGLQVAKFVLWSRSDLEIASVKSFLAHLNEGTLGAQTLIDVVEIMARREPLHELAGEVAVKARTVIEKEDEVTYRATLFAKLGRAITPASRQEASAYFRAGLEQMDAIGSGDYQFTNELLLFASSLKGDELSEQDFHTLTNICELNMPHEEHKFPWFAFAKGLSKTSGKKGLAKLARWHDRSKISLNYTLLPYLTALIEDGKIEPEDALALLRLSNPVELYSCDTSSFAKAIDKNVYSNSVQLINELIRQFEDNNPGIPMDSTVETLASLAEKTLGKGSETTQYLRAAHDRFGKIRHENNENNNYRGKSDKQSFHSVKDMESENRINLKKLAARIIPNDEGAMASAVDVLNGMQHIYDLKGEFFLILRGKVSFSDRQQYIQIIARLENLDIYTKLAELKKCKEEWALSSAALAELYKALAIPFIQLHTEDFLSFEQLSGYQLKNVSDLTCVPIITLAIELIRIFASSDWNVAASVWLGLASIISDGADSGEGQSALSRLLNSSSAKLATNVADGEWKERIYPSSDRVKLAAGLVWKMLGSPEAVDRWRAAHAIRCFAEFKGWDVVDALVARIGTEDAHPFQAPELQFYFLHARLWLLIALSRIAKDHPREIARYREVFMQIVLDEMSPHVLMRHFAAQALLTCAGKGCMKFTARIKKQIENVNVSQLPRLAKTSTVDRYSIFYQDKPKGLNKSKTEFSFDYDFEKHDIQYLSQVFGRPGWEVKGMMGEAVRAYDNVITSMYDRGGREGGRLGHMNNRHHSYGQYLGWHALFFTAGRLLSKYPVADDPYDEDLWAERMNRWLLTRRDGLWLSDGMDRPPLDTKINLLEKGEEVLVLTGNRAKLLSLICADFALGKEFVVDGDWCSPDNIKVRISSALVSSKKTKALVNSLIQEDPFMVWLPTYNEHEDDEGCPRSDKKGYIPWIVSPSAEAKLDEYDPLGGICAARRPWFARKISADLALKAGDPFGRAWKNPSGKELARSEAWGYENKYDDEESHWGVRLKCTGELLANVLTTQNSDLLVLISLRRYEKGYSYKNSKYSNTVAVVRIKRTLDFEYYAGAIDHTHQSRF